ncbi:MAG: DNA-directed RNA polymerase [Candidatus Pacearchaeota archaeon]
MFYIVTVEDYVRVDPSLFELDSFEAVKQQLAKIYENFHDRDLGVVIDVLEVLDVEDGVIIPGDGAAYYKSIFKLIVFKPKLQELVYCKVDEITSFGAFMDIGVMKGLIHISQTMEDYVSFSKSGSLSGKETKRSLNVGDKCLARIIAISYKGDEPKIGLTMRQYGLGKLEWIEADKEKEKKAQAAKESKELKEEKKKK